MRRQDRAAPRIATARNRHDGRPRGHGGEGRYSTGRWRMPFGVTCATHSAMRAASPAAAAIVGSSSSASERCEERAGAQEWARGSEAHGVRTPRRSNKVLNFRRKKSNVEVRRTPRCPLPTLPPQAPRRPSLAQSVSWRSSSVGWSTTAAAKPPPLQRSDAGRRPTSRHSVQVRTRCIHGRERARPVSPTRPFCNLFHRTGHRANVPKKKCGVIPSGLIKNLDSTTVHVSSCHHLHDVWRCRNDVRGR